MGGSGTGNARGVADFDRPTATCPACGAVFATAGAVRCPDCGLAFGR